MRALRLALLGACFAIASWAQSPVETKIAEGRAALANHDLAAARARFTEARTADPANETAAALLGITRWFALVGDAPAQAYLDGLGVAASGRDVYNWTAELDRNGDGAAALPGDYSVETAVAFWRDTLVPTAEAARADLAAVTSENFLLTLSAQEAGGVSITIDRGDLLMCQAALRGFEFLTFFLQGQDLDANAARLLELAQGDMGVLGAVLEENPDFMKVGSPSERASAKAALLDTIALYRRASAFIRNRAEGLERLFNLDAVDRSAEAELRLRLVDVERALNDFVETDRGRYVTAAPLFSDTWSLRDQLPAVTDGKFDPFAVQDSTLGGVALGLTREDVIETLISTGLEADLGWEQVNPKPVGQNLNEYVWTGSSHIVVGNAGTVGRSTDGVTWQYSQLRDAKDLYAIAVGAGRVVACGVSDIWMSSDDGVTWRRVLQAWTAEDYAHLGSFTDVAFGDGVFLALSTTGWIWRSTDGEAWERIAAVGTTAASLRALTVGENTFVAIGRDYISGDHRNAIFTSSDGETWTLAFSSAPSDYYYGVAYGDGQFLVVGSNGRSVYSSDAGASWSEGIIGAGSDVFLGVAYDDGSDTFVVSGRNGRVGTSSDRTTWSLLEASDTMPHFFDATAGPDGVYLSGSAGSVYRLSNGTLSRLDSNVSFANRNVAFRDVRAFAGKLHVVGSTNAVFESADGENFSATALPIAAALYSMCEHEGKLYAAGGNGTIVVNSGEGWNVVVSGNAELTTATLSKIRSLNGRLFAVGAAGTILTSVDGAVWTKQASGVSYSLNDVAYGNGMYVVVGVASTVLHSTDLVNWTSTPGYFYPILQAIAFRGEGFQTLGSDGVVYDLNYDADNKYWWIWRDWDSPRAFSDASDADGILYGAVAAPAGEAARAALPWSYDGERWLRSSLPGTTAMWVARFGDQLYLAGGYGGLVRSAPLPAGRPVPAALSQLTRTAGDGQTISLGAPVSASESLTYQWSRDGVPIAGATQAVLTLTGIQAADAGDYVVTATGAISGQSVTQTITLAVEPTAPTIVSQPSGGLASLGGTFVLAVTATGSEPLSYQWYKDGAKLTETSAVLNVSNITAGAAGAYHVVVTNGYGSAESEVATLNVAAAVPGFWSTAVDGSWGGYAPARTVHDGEGSIFAVWNAQIRPFDVNAGRLVPGLVRLDEDTGAVDPTFTWDDGLGVPLFVAPQADGKLLIAVSLGAQEGCTVVRVARDGAHDPSYIAPYFSRSIRFITLQSDGKLLVAATDPAGEAAPADAIMVEQPTVYRLKADGSLDDGFTPVVLTASVLTSGGMLFSPPEVDANGRIYLAGIFDEINGTARRNIARVSASGVLDGFADPAILPDGFTSRQARAFGIQSDGRVVVVGDFGYTARGTWSDPVMAIRFNLDGTFDTSFAQPLRSELPITYGVGARLRMVQVLPDDKLLAVSDHIMRLNADGSLDDGFTAGSLGMEAYWLSRSPVNGRVYVPDVKASGGIAAFDSDGAPFTEFNSGGWGRTQSPDSAFMLADGRLLATGRFNRYADGSVPGAVLFGAAGDVQTTLTSFHDPDAVRRDPYSHVVGWSDGSFVLQEIDYGDPMFGAGYRESVRRFRADGSEDRSWSLEAYWTGNYRLTATPTGRLLLWRTVADAQALVADELGDSLRRFNADGSLDMSFQPDLAEIASVERDGSGHIVELRLGQIVDVCPLPDDSVLLGVTDTQGNVSVIKLLPSGERDSSYEAPSFGTAQASSGYTDFIYDPGSGSYAQFATTNYSAKAINDLLALPDGRAWVTGSFDVDGLPVGIARLLADGAADPSFEGNGLDLVDGPPVLPVGLALASDDDGRVYLAGRFDRIDGRASSGLVRFTATGALDAWNPGVEIRAEQLTGVVMFGQRGYLHVFGSVARPGVAASAGYLRVSLETSAPVITTQPEGHSVTAGTYVTFSAIAVGTAPLGYQWSKDGAPIAGATAATLTLENVQAGDAGNYTVVVTNSVGSATSLAATLVVALPPVAPSVLIPPTSRTVTAGASVTFTVSASGANPLSYEWRKDGVAIAGQTGSRLTLANVQMADAGSYAVQISNAVGLVVSEPAILTVNPRSFAGYYSGSFGPGGGFWAMYIRPDNTGVYIAHLPQRRSIVIVNLTVNQNGTFNATSGEVRAAVRASGLAAARAGGATTTVPTTTVRAVGEGFTLAGEITDDGVVGDLMGLEETFSGEALASTGAAQSRAGFYTAAALDGGTGATYAIVAPSGEAFVVADVAGTVDGGIGSVDAAGEVQITTADATRLALTFDSGGAISAEVTAGKGGTPVTLGGLADGVASTSRLMNLSVRGLAGTGEQTLTLGFVTSGTGSKNVLVRAIGPTLSTYGVKGAMTNPRLVRFNTSSVLTDENDNWGGGEALAVTFARLGAFELPTNSADAALWLDLPPGISTAQVSGSDGRTGVALAEVYDGDTGLPLVRFVNFSVRNQVGIGDDVLVAGFVLAGNAPKTFLIRGVGPTLAEYGVSGALANPQLTLFRETTAIATNDDWAGTAELETAFSRTGAFGLPPTSQDSALLVTLPPGIYTVQVKGVGDTTGIALVEVYELP